MVFSNCTMLSVSHKSASVNEHTNTYLQQNKNTYSMGVPEVPVN